MTAQAALALCLLEGRVLTVYNCAKEVGYTNIAREIPRMIEKPFEVSVSRTSKEGKNRYGDLVNYTEYRLNRSEHNIPGIDKMIKFVTGQMGAAPPRTHQEEKNLKILDQIKMF